MRISKAARWLVLACICLGMSISAFGTAQTAMACSNAGCVTTVTSPSQIDTYVSPISVTAVTSTFTERATTSQVPSVSIPGSLGFTVMDARGNNQGFVASVTSSAFTSSLFPLLPISNTAILVSAVPIVTSVCYGPYNCGAGEGLGTSVGASLGSDPPVAIECPVASMGEGQYAVTVPLSLTVTGLTAEKLGSYPASYAGSFTVSVAEGQPLSTYAGYGCNVPPSVG
jgi:hypothetical protein